jgi:hypothetical protein
MIDSPRSYPFRGVVFKGNGAADAVVTAAIQDGLLHYIDVIMIGGDSHRRERSAAFTRVGY